MSHYVFIDTHIYTYTYYIYFNLDYVMRMVNLHLLMNIYAAYSLYLQILIHANLYCELIKKKFNFTAFMKLHGCFQVKEGRFREILQLGKKSEKKNNSFKF